MESRHSPIVSLSFLGSWLGKSRQENERKCTSKGCADEREEEEAMELLYLHTHNRDSGTDGWMDGWTHNATYTKEIEK